MLTGKTGVLLPAYDALKNLPRDWVGWDLVPTQDGWALDWEGLERLADIELLVVNFPHNPTGFRPSHEEWLRLVRWAEEREIWLFSDEMYRGLNLDARPDLPSAVELSERSLVLSGLSKPQGLPGLRAGWLITRAPSLMEKLFQWRLYTSICTASPVERLAEVALTFEEKLIARNRAIVERNVELAESAFRGSDEFRWRRPLAGSVALVELLQQESAERYCLELAEQHGVVLLPSSFLGFPDRYVRFGFGRLDFPAALDTFVKI